MNRWAVVILLVACMAFVGLVVWSTLRAAEVECEVCLVFDGQEVCRLGRGAEQADALQAAQESACGGNVSGMAELIACRGAPPVRSSCTDN